MIQVDPHPECSSWLSLLALSLSANALVNPDPLMERSKPFFSAFSVEFPLMLFTHFVQLYCNVPGLLPFYASFFWALLCFILSFNALVLSGLGSCRS